MSRTQSERHEELNQMLEEEHARVKQIKERLVKAEADRKIDYVLAFTIML